MGKKSFHFLHCFQFCFLKQGTFITLVILKKEEKHKKLGTKIFPAERYADTITYSGQDKFYE